MIPTTAALHACNQVPIQLSAKTVSAAARAAGKTLSATFLLDKHRHQESVSAGRIVKNL